MLEWKNQCYVQKVSTVFVFGFLGFLMHVYILYNGSNHSLLHVFIPAWY